jgi:STE24 endopeptidase
MEARRSRLPAAILVVVVAAGAATLLLRPRGVVEPASVNVEEYFSAAEVKRAEDYRDPQRLIGLAQLALTGGVLVLFVVRPPRRLVAPLARRPIVGGATMGAAIALALVPVGLPLAAVAHERARDVGLSTQDWGPWLGDVAKSAVLEVGFAAIGGALALALVRRFRRRWWIPGSAAVLGVGVVTVWLFPVVIDPIFNRFEPLPKGPLRAQVLELAREADVDVGEVYRVDASRRTTGVNAYVNGLGHSKRVVLYDNLIDDLPREQVLQVVAHELGHQHHRDLMRGLAWLALVAPAGTYLAQVLAERLGRREGLGDPAVRPGPTAVPALALSAAIVAFGLGIAGNQLSRPVEASADSFSLDLTRDPAAHIALERTLSRRNVSDPDPPAVFRTLFGTHPSTIQRIGIGEAWARDH